MNADQNIHAPKESYCFTKHERPRYRRNSYRVAGLGTVAEGRFDPVHDPPGGSIYKVVGPGKDVSMPVAEVGAATFVHNGPAGSIKADAYLVKESTLDVIADSPVSFSQ